MTTSKEVTMEMYDRIKNVQEKIVKLKSIIASDTIINPKYRDNNQPKYKKNSSGGNSHKEDEVKDHIIYRELDSIRVKGKTEPVMVYEVMARTNDGISEAIQNSIDFFQHGLQFYKEQKWDEAITRFKQTLELVPDDPPSKIYIERCEAFKDNPPGEDWDGVYTMTTK